MNNEIDFMLQMVGELRVTIGSVTQKDGRRGIRSPSRGSPGSADSSPRGDLKVVRVAVCVNSLVTSQRLPYVAGCLR